MLARPGDEADDGKDNDRKKRRERAAVTDADRDLDEACDVVKLAAGHRSSTVRPLQI